MGDLSNIVPWESLRWTSGCCLLGQDANHQHEDLQSQGKTGTAIEISLYRIIIIIYYILDRY